MSIVEGLTEYKNTKLHYARSGNGSRSMLLFHGFGQNHNAFKILFPTLSVEYTYYSFDLFFHGNSQWNRGEEPIEKKYWKELLEKFFHENNIEKFSIAGFSLGCRFVLASVEAFPEKTENVYLLAPDGIKVSFWYTIATYPLLFRKIFKSMIHHPSTFKIIAHTLYELRLMDRSLLKFAEHQMNTIEKRQRVYYSWVVFRHLRFNIVALAKVINDHNISITFVNGKLDHVIKARSITPLLKRLNKHKLVLLDTGHNGLLKDIELIKVFESKQIH